MRYWFCLFAIGIGLANVSRAQIWLEQTQLDTQSVATGLDIPWDMQRWGEDTLIFTERTGAIKRLSVVGGQVDVLYQVPDLAIESQSGLMGLQLYPDFSETAFVYVAYTYYSGTNIRMRVERLAYEAVNDTLTPDSIVVDNIETSNTNIGGRMMITATGELFLTAGDAKNNAAAQDPSSLNGKVLRYTLQGEAHPDNATAGAYYSLGHRNPQGIIRLPDDRVLISEHGPSSNDELNILQSDGNYGWPHVVGPCNSSTQELCDSLGVIEPIHAWSPTIAPAGIDYCDLSTIPEWENTVLVASLKEERLLVVFLDQSYSSVEYVSWILYQDYGRMRDVLVADGKIYICTSNQDALGEPKGGDDRIIQLTPSQHNSVNEMEEGTLGFWVQHDHIILSEPVSGEATVYDLLGRTTGQQVLNRGAIIPLPEPGLNLVRLETDRGTQMIKAYRP